MISKLSLIKRKRVFISMFSILNQHRLVSPVIPFVQRRKVQLEDRKEIPTRLQRKSRQTEIPTQVYLPTNSCSFSLSHVCWKSKLYLGKKKILCLPHNSWKQFQQQVEGMRGGSLGRRGEKGTPKAIYLLLPRAMLVVWELLLQGHQDQMALYPFLPFLTLGQRGPELTGWGLLLVWGWAQPARRQFVSTTCNKGSLVEMCEVSLWPLCSYLLWRVWHTGGSRQHTCKMCSASDAGSSQSQLLNHWRAYVWENMENKAMH